MNMTARKGRQIRRFRRMRRQVLAVEPVGRGGFTLLYWTPRRFDRLPWGCQR